ncbi:hypothetical protein QBC36DRAFT_150316, partial [Triangularia setosa]
WTGDVRYLRKDFFESLRDYEVTEDKSVIRLKASGILLHIADAVGAHEWIPMLDPSKLFCRKGSQLSTQVVYYTENVLHEIHQIGSIEGRSIKKRKAVRDVCSIRLKFRDGSPVDRVFENPKRTVEVRQVENGRDGVPRWRV